MKSRALGSIVAAALLFILVAAGTSVAESSPSATSASAVCGSTTEGASDAAATACEQGFNDATAHAALGASCALTVGKIEAVEYEHDCKFGFIFAGGVTQTAPTPTSAAASECASITRGASDGSPAACEQGYQDALAGDTQDASCDHIGAGAITAVEYANSCEDGWFVAKGEPSCIPGIEPTSGQPGTTIAADAEVDKTCSATP